MSTLTESALDPAKAIYDFTLLAGDPWIHVIKKGQTFRILDLEGNQAADTLLFSAEDPIDRYSAQDTIREQGALYLTTGTKLISTRGNVLLTITADNCGRHDTLGGACACESNMVRYAIEKRFMHACRDSFLRGARQMGLGKRDIAHNINFFMNVPVEADGTLGIVDGLSAPGKSLTLRAERDTLVLVSNCPQVNNPCNGFDPTPVQMVVTR